MANNSDLRYSTAGNFYFLKGLLRAHFLIFNHEIFQTLWQAIREIWEILMPPRSNVCPCRPGPGLPTALLEDSPRWKGQALISPASGSQKMGHFRLSAYLTSGHLILAGFVLFILVNRAVYFQFWFLGVLAHFAFLVFTLCKLLGLSKYVYKVPETWLFCVWYFNGL